MVPFLRSYDIILIQFFTMVCIQVRESEGKEKERIEKEGQVVSPSVYFVKQTIGNACGTIGLLHALGNCQDKITFSESWHCMISFTVNFVTMAAEDGYLKTFFEKTKSMTPEERADFLEEDDVRDLTL